MPHSSTKTLILHFEVSIQVDRTWAMNTCIVPFSPGWFLFLRLDVCLCNQPQDNRKIVLVPLVWSWHVDYFSKISKVHVLLMSNIRQAEKSLSRLATECKKKRLERWTIILHYMNTSMEESSFSLTWQKNECSNTFMVAITLQVSVSFQLWRFGLTSQGRDHFYVWIEGPLLICKYIQSSWAIRGSYQT